MAHMLYTNKTISYRVNGMTGQLVAELCRGDKLTLHKGGAGLPEIEIEMDTTTVKMITALMLMNKDAMIFAWLIRTYQRVYGIKEITNVS